MSLYDSTVPQLTKMLRHLDAWLGAAEEHAKKKSFDAGTLLVARLAPDQYPLVRQVQTACDAAKFLAARLAGKEAPKNEDVETTMEQLHARIRATVSYLETFKAADFAGAEARKVPLPFLQNKLIAGTDYACQMALPNFYFHVTHAYAILRHNGVDLGKRDFIGNLPLIDG